MVSVGTLMQGKDGGGSPQTPRDISKGQKKALLASQDFYSHYNQMVQKKLRGFGH